MHFSARKVQDSRMRTTVTIEDDLYEKAQALAGPSITKAELVREALRTYIRVQAAKRLASLGGTAPEMETVVRRRSGSPPP